MESEQKPKEIKIEFTCEVKEKPLSPKLQKRKKIAEAAETLFSFIVVILSLLLPYIVVFTNDWSEAQYTLFFTLLVMSCFSICAVRLCHFIYKKPTLKKEKGGYFFPSDYFFKEKLPKYWMLYSNILFVFLRQN